MKFIMKPARAQKGEGKLIDRMNEEMKENRKAALKGKIKTVSRMMKMFRTLRMEQETIIEIKGLSSDNKIPKGLLGGGKEALVTTLELFHKVKAGDLVNESWPED